jgi:hypothetical protein
MERCTFHTASGDAGDRCSAGLLSTVEDVGGGAHDGRARLSRAGARRIWIRRERTAHEECGDEGSARQRE